ncbi:MAG: hypothetical protein ACE5MH_07290, partial [Terriglobia bacterium]
FSPRVQDNALKLVCAFSLPAFFAQQDEKLEVSEEALNLALKFLVEEIAVRQKVEIDIDRVLFNLGISEINRFVQRMSKTRAQVQVVDWTEAPEIFDRELSRDAHLLSLDLRPRKRFRQCEAKLSKELGDVWEGLEEQTREFLVTGDLVFGLLRENPNGNVDFTPVVIEYSKALEYKLAGKLLGKFRQAVGSQARQEEFFDTSPLERVETPSDLRFLRTSLRIVRDYLGEKGELTLGVIAHFLREARNERYQSIPLFKSFSDFLNSKPEHKRVIEVSFVHGVHGFVEQYRNRAAHSAVLSALEAEKCRSTLLGPGGLLLALGAPKE